MKKRPAFIALMLILICLQPLLWYGIYKLLGGWEASKTAELDMACGFSTFICMVALSFYMNEIINEDKK